MAIAPQAGCGAGVTATAAAEVLRRDGCKAVLRATYVDATWSYVMTVGVAVLPSDAAATEAYQSLSQPRLAAADRPEADRLTAGVLVVRYHGTAAAMYDYSRQISASFADGPYLVMYAAGYADSRPRVPVTSDRLLLRGDDQPGQRRRPVGRRHRWPPRPPPRTAREPPDAEPPDAGAAGAGSAGWAAGRARAGRARLRRVAGRLPAPPRRPTPSGTTSSGS